MVDLVRALTHLFHWGPAPTVAGSLARSDDGHRTTLAALAGCLCARDRGARRSPPGAAPGAQTAHRRGARPDRDHPPPGDQRPRSRRPSHRIGGRRDLPALPAGRRELPQGRPRRQSAGCAVVALGGYGRRELNPSSDVDVMFLYPRNVDDYVSTVLNHVLYFLWDLGFTVGHSCRSLADAQRMMETDLTARTAMLEVSLPGGPPGGVCRDAGAHVARLPGPTGPAVRLGETGGARASPPEVRRLGVRAGAECQRGARWTAGLPCGTLDRPGPPPPGHIRRLLHPGSSHPRGGRPVRPGPGLPPPRPERASLSPGRETRRAESGGPGPGGRPPRVSRRPRSTAVEQFMRHYYLRAGGLHQLSARVIERCVERTRLPCGGHDEEVAGAGYRGRLRGAQPADPHPPRPAGMLPSRSGPTAEDLLVPPGDGVRPERGGERGDPQPPRSHRRRLPPLEPRPGVLPGHPPRTARRGRDAAADAPARRPHGVHSRSSLGSPAWSNSTTTIATRWTSTPSSCWTVSNRLRDADGPASAGVPTNRQRAAQTRDPQARHPAARHRQRRGARPLRAGSRHRRGGAHAHGACRPATSPPSPSSSPSISAWPTSPSGETWTTSA